MNDIEKFNSALELVLSLASSELCSIYEIARRDSDEELFDHAGQYTAAITLTQPFIKVIPEMVKALEWYANTNNYITTHRPPNEAEMIADLAKQGVDVQSVYVSQVDIDHGYTARKVLADLEIEQAAMTRGAT